MHRHLLRALLLALGVVVAVAKIFPTTIRPDQDMQLVRMCAAYHNEACAPPGPCLRRADCVQRACMPGPGTCLEDPDNSWCADIACASVERQQRDTLASAARRLTH